MVRSQGGGLYLHATIALDAEEGAILGVVLTLAWSDKLGMPPLS